MQSLHEQYEAVQQLFEAADFVSALSLIKQSQRALRDDLPLVAHPCNSAPLPSLPL